MAACAAAAADDPLASAMKLYGKHHYEQAAHTLEQALPRLDANRAAQAQLVLGTVYLGNAYLHEALAHAGAAVELDYLKQLTKTGAEGRSRYARLFLAETLLANGKPVDAARIFKPLRAKSGLDARHVGFARVGLGSTEWVRKQTQRARKLWAGAGKAPDAALARAAAKASVGAGNHEIGLGRYRTGDLGAQGLGPGLGLGPGHRRHGPGEHHGLAGQRRLALGGFEVDGRGLPRQILDDLAAALVADEVNQPLVPALDDLTRRAGELIADQQPKGWTTWHSASIQVDGSEGYVEKLRELAEALEREVHDRGAEGELRLEVSATIFHREPGEE